MNVVVAIDGPAGTGKSSVSRGLAQALGVGYLDSGATYRIATLAVLRAGADPADTDAVTAAVRAAQVTVGRGEDADRFFLDGEDVSAEIRDAAVTGAVSAVSAVPAVREELVALQRRLAAEAPGGVVAEGRDIGSVVLPDADLKVFLTASAATRAERRYKQLISKGISANIKGLREDLEARDERDKTRSASPLEPAQDALLLDNSALGIEESVTQVLDWWKQRRPF